jgi:aryl-phospho-beta-D-glucosidase BglC (GH1 family)
MSQNWHMNAVRIPLSNWIYSADPTNYLKMVDQVVQEANAAGLYTILNLHDDAPSGSPYGTGVDTPKPESIAFWKVFAAHYASNPMVLFDAFNEPMYPDGPTWLNGGGATMQNANQLVLNFLNYATQNGMSWTAWQFDAPHLLLNMSTFTPTRLNDPNHRWVCNSPNSTAGMGTVVQQFLLSH